MRMHCVYIMFTLHVFLACFCDVFIVLSYMTRPLESVLMARYSHSKPLTLEVAHAVRLCGEDAWLDGAPTPCRSVVALSCGETVQSGIAAARRYTPP